MTTTQKNTLLPQEGVTRGLLRDAPTVGSVQPLPLACFWADLVASWLGRLNTLRSCSSVNSASSISSNQVWISAPFANYFGSWGDAQTTSLQRAQLADVLSKGNRSGRQKESLAPFITPTTASALARFLLLLVDPQQRDSTKHVL